MDNAIIQALRRARQAYMTNVGEPTAQLVGGGVRGYLGLDAPEYADGRGMEAYRNAQAIANTPVVGVPAMAARAGTRAAPAVAKALREHSKGFQEYNRALGPAGASQAIVWHGSPHKFDAFDSSKIGTGEGAQAYGHGLYLAESPGVAESYRKALSDNVFTVGGKDISGPTSKYGQPAQNPARAGLSVTEKMATYALDSAIKAGSSDPAADAIKHLTKYGKGNPDAASAIEVVRQWSQQGGKVEAGNLYKVDLPDEKIARMLDWDKPLSQQAIGSRMSVVKNEAPAFGDEKWLVNLGDTTINAYKTKREAAAALESATGQDLWKALDASGARAGTDRLRQQGIPGIRYLDQGSRQFASDAYAGLEKTKAKVARLEAEFAKNPSQALQSRLEDARQELMSAKRGVGDLSSNFVVFPGEEAALTILERNNEIINALRKKKQQ